MKNESKFYFGLAALCLIDAFIPLPIVGLVLFGVLIQRAAWFRDVIRDIYGR